MGRAMALNLQERSFAVTVADADAAAIAFFGQKWPLVCEFTHLYAMKIAVIIAVVDAEQIRQVLFGEPSDGSQAHHGLADRLCAGSVVVITSTIGPGDLANFAAELRERGIHTLDAPISGGPAKARDASMSLMLAGDREAVKSTSALLQALSQHIQPMGERLGDASAAKLINNALAAVHLYNHCCDLMAAEAIELELAAVNRLVAASSGQSWIGNDRMARQLAGNFEPTARMALLAKDSALAMAMLRRKNLPAQWSQPAADCIAAACAAGLAYSDDSALIAYLRKLAR